VFCIDAEMDLAKSDLKHDYESCQRAETFPFVWITRVADRIFILIDEETLNWIVKEKGRRISECHLEC